MTPENRGVAWMANLMHSPCNRQGLTIVLKAYLDDSGTNQAERAVAVAGFVASTELWTSFETRWRKILDCYDLPRFHAANYLARKRPFSRWPDDKYQECGRDVCAAFRDITPLGIGNTVDLEVFHEWRYSVGIFINPDPYYFCLDLCLRSLIRGISQVPNDEGVMIFVDRDNGRENLGVQIGRWHEEYIRRFPQDHINPDRSVSVTYGPDIEYLPLQAADVLVNGSFQWMKEFLRTRPGDPAPPENMFLRAMRNQPGPDPITLRHFHSAELLDIEFRKMIRNPVASDAGSEEQSS